MKSTLDAEETKLLKSFEKGEWVSSKKIKKEKKEAKSAASHYLQKKMRINIRLSQTDLHQIKQRAAFEGMPYQTLIASVLHKFAAGHG